MDSLALFLPKGNRPVYHFGDKLWIVADAVVAPCLGEYTGIFGKIKSFAGFGV